MKRIGFIALLCLAVMTSKVSGQEAVSNEGVEEPTAEEASLGEVYTFPEIKPEGSIFGGYRFVTLSGSSSADQYEYLHDSVPLGGSLRVFSFPHRLQLEIDEVNIKDYFGDLSYAYKDLIVFRGIDRTLFHNLNNIRLAFGDNTLTPPPFAAAHFARDAADVQYGVKTSMNNAFLRFKMPDFPFHVYVEAGLVDKDGDQQQRNLLGSALFNSPVRVSQSRDVDSQTKTLVIGTNSHLGPIEVDISHGEKRFNVSGDKVLFDSYVAGDDPTSRAAGVYPHNEIPELKGSSNTLKLHTSYTGSIVADATFTKFDNENRDSGARADYFVGGGEVTWMPMPRLTFFLKYRHKEADIDNPGSVAITDITNPLNTYTYQVKPSISSITDTVSGTVRYRPLPKLSLKADYTFEHIRRENAQEWNLPESTQRQTISISADARISKELTLKARYTHRDINNPATNIEPDHSDEGRVSLSWIPLPQINTLLSYSLAKEKRNQQSFVEADNTVTEADSRNVNRERLLGSVTFVVLKDLSVTASYSYMRNKIYQDIDFSDLATFTPHLDPFVPYDDSAHTYSFGLNYMPVNNVTLNAAVSYTISSGSFYPTSPLLLQPVSVASFSQLDLRETNCALSGEYRFKGGFALGLRYKYSNTRDELDNPFGALHDGTAHIMLLTASKRW